MPWVLVCGHPSYLVDQQVSGRYREHHFAGSGIFTMKIAGHGGSTVVTEFKVVIC